MSNRPPCAAWAEKLALRREDLLQGERAALDAHLTYCDACQQAQADYIRLDRALRKLPRSVLAPDIDFAMLLDADDELALQEDYSFVVVPSARNRQQDESGALRKRTGKVLPLLLVACILLSFIMLGRMYNAMTNAAHAAGTALLTYRRQSDFISAVAWSPDGKYIATGSWAHTVQIWNAQSGALVTTYKGHDDFVSAVAWSPDGKYIASGSWDHTVQVWDAFTGQAMLTYTGQRAEVSALAWSPDGAYIASGSWDHTIQVWNAFTGQLRLTYNGHHEFIYTLAWSPDGKEIASGGSDSTMQIWNAHTGVTRMIFDDYATGDPVNTLAWSPDGK